MHPAPTYLPITATEAAGLSSLIDPAITDDDRSYFRDQADRCRRVLAGETVGGVSLADVPREWVERVLAAMLRMDAPAPMPTGDVRNAIRAAHDIADTTGEPGHVLLGRDGRFTAVPASDVADMLTAGWIESGGAKVPGEFRASWAQ